MKKKKVKKAAVKKDVVEQQAERGFPAQKLSKFDVNEIRKLYWIGEKSQTYLARRYKVHQSNVSQIVNFKSWV